MHALGESALEVDVTSVMMTKILQPYQWTINNTININ